MSHVCPAVLEIENHSLVVIATDSYDLQPASVDSFYSNSGERYDFVVNANQSGGKRDLRQCFVLLTCLVTFFLDISLIFGAYKTFTSAFELHR
jgi:hypothetical protein